MKAPESLETLIEYGIIQEVLRPLMSGKEAQVFVVLAGGEECVAKVYKEATQRTFKHRVVYTEGRRTRNTRDQRAMNKRSQHGRKRDEEAWRRTEVDMIYRLRDAGVRVPEPFNFVEGVLVMELVRDGDGQPAPRLGDLRFSPDEARAVYQTLIREVVRMLCAGVIHGDLSEFNVLMTDSGPVVIDFPQAVDPTQNPNSKKLLLRDVANLDRFLARFAPDDPVSSYGEEIWSLFEKNRLRPDSKLSGRFEKPKGKVDTSEVMSLVEDARRENRMRQGGRGDEGDGEDDVERPDPASAASPVTLRRVVDFSKERGQSGASRPTSARKRGAGKRGARSAEGRSRAGAGEAADRSPSTRKPVPPAGPASDSVGTKRSEAAPSRRRRRRPGNTSSSASSEGEGASRRKGRPRRDGEGPQPPAGPRGAKGAGRAEASEKPSRPRGRRSRAQGNSNTDPAEKRSPAKPRGESRSSSTRARPDGEGADEKRPARRRRRRSPKARSTP